jgi:hypothetical protein
VKRGEKKGMGGKRAGKGERGVREARRGETELKSDGMTRIGVVEKNKRKKNKKRINKSALLFFIPPDHATAITLRPADSRNIMIHRRQRTIRSPHFPLGIPQPFKSLRTSHLMDQMSIDIDQRLSFFAVDEVVVVYLVVEGSRGGSRCWHGEVLCVYVCVE